MDERSPVFFFAPFVSSTMRVDPAWIDYNGHLNMAFYHVFFDQALDEAFGQVGLGQDYVERRRASCFVAEMHTLYRRELQAHDAVRVTLQLVDFDEKRLHVSMEVRHEAEGWLSAAAEAMCLHMDMEARRVSPFPEDIQANLAVMRAAHARLAKPQFLGRTIGIPAGSTSQGTRREPLRVCDAGR